MTLAQFDDSHHGTPCGDATRNDVWLYIRRYVNERGYAPSQREIARDCYYAQSTVRYALARLAAQGRLAVTPGMTRGIRLVDKGAG